jgi:hypothetical protein
VLRPISRLVPHSQAGLVLVKVAFAGNFLPMPGNPYGHWLARRLCYEMVISASDNFLMGACVRKSRKIVVDEHGVTVRMD